MKKLLRGTCRRVGKKTFVRGLDRGMKLIALVLLVLAVWAVVSCGKEPEKGDVYRIYEVVETQMVVESSEDNPKMKKPVFVENVKYVVTKGEE